MFRGAISICSYQFCFCLFVLLSSRPAVVSIKIIPFLILQHIEKDVSLCIYYLFGIILLILDFDLYCDYWVSDI